MIRKTLVVIKYYSYNSNSGLIQYVQVLSKNKKEVLKTIKKKTDVEVKDLLIEMARRWCERNKYYVDYCS